MFQEYRLAVEEPLYELILPTHKTEGSSMKIFIYICFMMTMPYWGWAQNTERWDAAYYYSSNFLTTSNSPQKTQENIQQILSHLQTHQITINQFKSQNGEPFLFLLAENLQNKPIYFLEVLYTLVLNQELPTQTLSSAIKSRFKLLTNEVLNLTYKGRPFSEMIYSLKAPSQKLQNQLDRLIDNLLKSSIPDERTFKLKARTPSRFCHMMFS
ncbi:MAG: hypothetical protein MK008_10775 [Bdellovibrionales bacterium]|nr:hypothetical protein [Bdellovibrionales bacterium]